MVNKLSLFAAPIIDDVFAVAATVFVVDTDGLNTDVNCSLDCRNIDFDFESSFILANGLFFMESESFNTLSSPKRN